MAFPERKMAIHWWQYPQMIFIAGIFPWKYPSIFSPKSTIARKATKTHKN